MDSASEMRDSNWLADEIVAATKRLLKPTLDSTCHPVVATVPVDNQNVADRVIRQTHKVPLNLNPYQYWI